MSDAAVSIEDFPSSVEEAAALLGATTQTLASSSVQEANMPPTGMHPAFATVSKLVGPELISRLYMLRAVLRTEASKSVAPLPAAPSILQVLKKMLGISTQLAVTAATTSSDSLKNSSNAEQRRLVLQHRRETPPLLSTPCRILWVDCVVLCHALWGNTAELTKFIRQMLALALIHPRSAKAGGGVRVAALQVVAALFEYTDKYGQDKTKKYSLASQLAPWTLDVLQVCLKALRSAGNGEPTYREMAIRAACATATACRNAALKNRQVSEKDAFLLTGGMEDKAIVEAIKVLKQAVLDKFPEIRSVAATFAATLAPMLVPAISSRNTNTDPLSHLEEVLQQICCKNIDDERPIVADQWAEAAARCIITALKYHEDISAQANERSNPEGDVGSSSASSSPSAAARFGARKTTFVGLVHSSFTTFPRAIDYLVKDQFVACGGELAAVRCGGTFSTGGRSVRLGYCLILTKLLRLKNDSIGEARKISINALLISILRMVGEAVEKQLSSQGTRSWSKADAGLVRMFACRVLRQGLSEISAEPAQASILQELIHLGLGMDANFQQPNANQLQVLLIEVANLISSLGEASASRLDELNNLFTKCLSHPDNGVRHEAAMACAAMSSVLPSEGRKMIGKALVELKDSKSKVLAATSSDDNESDEAQSGLRVFRRAQKEKKTPSDGTRPQQYAIHGRSIMVSLVVNDLPNLPGGLACDLIGDVVNTANLLLSVRYHETFPASNGSAVCTCVRAGFCLLSGVLSTGPKGAQPHVKTIVEAWQKAVQATKDGGKGLASHHDLVCLDACLTSIVAFLQHCSELLLVVPEVLNLLTVVLEDVFPLIQPGGRFANTASNAAVASRFESAIASILEAFAWLPSGSFPILADQVFSFAANQIRQAVDNNTTCSILYSLVTKEDYILDSRTFSRANRECQVGGAKGLEETIVSLSTDIANQAEREAVLHLRSEEIYPSLCPLTSSFRGSRILEAFASDKKRIKPPTPLHEVGTWRRPFDPSRSSRVRMIDAAVQAFSATFGLKDGKEQQAAMEALESMVPPLHTQIARTMGLTTSIAEQDRRSRAKEDSAAVANITAVLLACLQALPLHEATHNVPIGLGPPWMNKAKDLLLTLLPSNSTIVRRAAAEGLALLATLGVTEDAHFLQSTLLHSLDEVMQGNKPDGKARAISLEPISAARAGSLLTLACIQRTAYNVTQRKHARARMRALGSKTEEAVDKSNENLPVLQMMTRILPSAACHGFRDYFTVKTYALHSFAVLLIYCNRLSSSELSDEDKQLLRKAIEVVEDNFTCSWTAASMDVDRGQESSKLASEIVFLSVCLRLMGFLLPYLHHVAKEDRDVARRFSLMASIILENYGAHPVVFVEAMAFFEVLSSNLDLMLQPSNRVLFSENFIFSPVPVLLASLTPSTFDCQSRGTWQMGTLIPSVRSLRAGVFYIKAMADNRISLAHWSKMNVSSLLLATLDNLCGSKMFRGGSMLQLIATGREVGRLLTGSLMLETEIFAALHQLLNLEKIVHANTSENFLRWVLFSRQVLVPFTSEAGLERDGEQVYNRAEVSRRAVERAILDTTDLGSVRWQVKSLAAQLAAVSIEEMIKAELLCCGMLTKSPQFDLGTASSHCSKECAAALESKDSLPQSYLVFHLEDIVSAACMSSVSTLDQTELGSLQETSMHFLTTLVKGFGLISDIENPTSSILSQFSTQLVSSVRHALSSPSDSCPYTSMRLFVAGCEALLSLVQCNVVTDLTAAKRLIRGVVPAEETLPVFKYDEGLPSSLLHLKAETSSDGRALVAKHIAGLWTVGKLLFNDFDTKEDVSNSVFALREEFFKSDVGFAVHCGAAAVDGCRAMFHCKQSTKSNVDVEQKRIMRGFFLEGYSTNDFVNDLCIRVWPACCRTALNIFLKCEQESVCEGWMDVLFQLLITGYFEALELYLVHDENLDELLPASYEPSYVLIDCLHALSLVVRDKPNYLVDSKRLDLELVTRSIGKEILMPVVLASESKPFGLDVVVEACRLLEEIAASERKLSKNDSSFFVTLLQPLNEVLVGNVNFEDKKVTELMLSCLKCIGLIVKDGVAPPSLVHAILEMIQSEILSGNAQIPDEVKEAGKLVLIECLGHKSLSNKEKSKVANRIVRLGYWDGWLTIFMNDDTEAYTTKSLSLITGILRDPSESEIQRSFLSSLRYFLQKHPTENMVGRILHHIGADVVTVLYQYGTAKVSEDARKIGLDVCADGIKIILAAYQQLSSQEASNETITDFIVVVFGALLPILRFNGLPNHASPEPLADAALGRISAQTMLHVAKMTPIPFKSSMTRLNDHERALLEFAVRAEMSGYETSTQRAPVKKVLNLKGFKK